MVGTATITVDSGVIIHGKCYGGMVLVSAISPYREARDEARRIIGDFIEVYVDTQVATCELRDPRRAWRAAGGRYRIAPVPAARKREPAVGWVRSFGIHARKHSRRVPEQASVVGGPKTHFVRPCGSPGSANGFGYFLRRNRLRQVPES